MDSEPAEAEEPENVAYILEETDSKPGSIVGVLPEIATESFPGFRELEGCWDLSLPSLKVYFSADWRLLTITPALTRGFSWLNEQVCTQWNIGISVS